MSVPLTACLGMPRVVSLAMTRKQVADRLGRSLATVRRLEGDLLHPRRDARGVHHFDRAEVETVARGLDAGRGPVNSVDESDWQRKPNGPCLNCADLKEQVDTLGEEIDGARQSHRRALEALEFENERTEGRLRAEMSALEREAADTERQLRAEMSALEREVAEYVSAVERR